MQTRQLLKIAALAAGLTFALAGCSALSTGNSNTVMLGGNLSGASEVPPVNTTGSGTVETRFDKSTQVLTWKVSFTGLSGPATAAHFHGPAAPGSNAGVVIPFSGSTSPIEGSATLTPAQAADLLAGKWYANVHTAANKGGEVRAQISVR